MVTLKPVAALRGLADRHPSRVAIVLLTLVALVFAVPVLLSGPVDLTNQTGFLSVESLVLFIPLQAIYCVVLLSLVALIGWGRRTGLTARADRNGLRLSLWIIGVCATLLMMLLALILTEVGPPSPISMIALILALNALVGVFEEVLFRGIVLQGLRECHGPGAALMVSSVLFGVFHLTNLAVGQDLALTVFQVALASALGIFLGALTLQARSLWPAIILHAIWNSYVMSGQLLARVTTPEVFTEAQRISAANYVLPVIIAALGGWIYRRWIRRGGHLRPQLNG